MCSSDLTERWAAGELSGSAAGSFAAFQARVHENLRAIIAAAAVSAMGFTRMRPASISAMASASRCAASGLCAPSKMNAGESASFSIRPGKDTRASNTFSSLNTDTNKFRGSQVVTFKELFYWRHYYHEDETNFKAIQRIVFVEGIDEPVVNEPYVGQKRGQDGRLLGVTTLPIRILTLTYISDDSLPPSDSTIGRLQVQSIEESRDAQAQQQKNSIPMRWGDTNRVSPNTKALIDKGDFGAGTSSPETFLRALGPQPYRVAYVQPSRRPDERGHQQPPAACHPHRRRTIFVREPRPARPADRGPADGARAGAGDRGAVAATRQRRDRRIGQIRD